MDSNDRERIDGDNGARDELHRMVSLQKILLNINECGISAHCTGRRGTPKTRLHFA